MKGITVNEALELLKGHGVILKAEHNGLSNNINSVSVLEIAKWHDWIHGGELYLTTLNALKSKEEIYDMIKIFGEKKVAALALHPGNNLEIPMDEHAYRLADQVNLPVLILPRTIPYSTVLTIVLGAILNKQKLYLEKSQQINRYLTDILLTGGSFEKIALSLQRLIKNPVVIVDSNLEVLAAVGNDEYSAELFTDKSLAVLNEIHSDISYDTERGEGTGPDIITYKGTAAFNEGSQMLFAKVAVGSELYGYIITLGNRNTCPEFDTFNTALTHAVTAVALEESKRRAIKKAEQKLNIDFLEDLLNQHYDSEETIRQRAKHLGFELKGKHVVMIVDIDRFEDYYLKNLTEGEEHFQKVKNRLCNIVEFSARARSKKSIVIPKSNSLIVLPHIEGADDEHAVKGVLNELAGEIMSQVNSLLSNITVSIGIGGYCEKLSDLSRSFQQAKQALKIGYKVRGGNGIFHFDELGIYAILLSFGTEEVKEACMENLAKILAYDEHNKCELIKTMEMYLDCNESISRTAERLYIHPNTVKYRLERIKEILGKNPFENGEEKLYYHLSLKALKIL